MLSFSSLINFMFLVILFSIYNIMYTTLWWILISKY